MFMFMLAGFFTAENELFASPEAPREKLLEPSGTYLYDEKGGQKLYLDIYDPAPESKTAYADGTAKPSVLFLFGGGFVIGKRDHESYNPWFKALTDEGFKVISIDYRLGMKDSGARGFAVIEAIHKAVEMAVEDLFSATAFLIDNAAELGIDPAAIVTAGSSAGAMTVLQAEWEISSRGPLAAVLPEGFDYAGVMSFSGAVFSDRGAIRYSGGSAPTLLFHGTADKIVPYNRNLRILKLQFSSSPALARFLRKDGAVCSFYRFKGAAHEIASSMMRNLEEELQFIEMNVVRKDRRVVDATVEDPSIPPFRNLSLKQMYNNN